MAPVWLMGMTNSVFGMYAGIVLISLPHLLSDRHVPATTIAGMVAVMASPGFWTFLFSPILDVYFSRRWYSIVCASMAALLLVIALLNLDNLMLVQCLLIAGYFFANLYQSALGGWLSSITSEDKKNAMSSWVTIANVSSGGVIAMVTGELMQNLAPEIAAVLLGLIILLPTSIFFFMPAPGPDRRLARDSFTQFFGEVFSLLKRREVLIAIILFVAPAATFSLTNFLSDVGEDYHASSRLVSLVGGLGIIAGGLGGGLLFRLVDRLLPLRFLYLAVGVAGSLFSLALIALPRTPTFYGIAFLGENIFQGLAITTSIAIAFETIGHRNPLAATVYCLVTSAFNIPIFYMQLIDGWGYGKQGVSGSFAADAGMGIVASVLLAALLLRVGRKPAFTQPSVPH